MDRMTISLVDKKKKQQAAKKAWYERNKALTLQRTKYRRKKKDQYVLQYKLENSICPDCDISWAPYQLDFDHVSENKIAGINQIVRNGTMKQLLEEINKCELICSNCHRHRTYMRSLKI
jgi:hypothetical protein